MSDELILGLAVILGSLAVVVLVFLILAFRYPDVIRDFFNGVKDFRVGLTGIRITRAVHAAEQAVEQKEGQKPDRKKLREHLSGIPKSTRVLWVDDNPENNSHEIEALERLGIEVDAVKSNDEAKSAAGQKGYDLIISDIHRGEPESADAGLELARALDGVLRKAPPIVYYTGHVTSARTPDGYPVTDRPSDLFDLIRSELSPKSEIDVEA